MRIDGGCAGLQPDPRRLLCAGVRSPTMPFTNIASGWPNRRNIAAQSPKCGSIPPIAQAAPSAFGQSVSPGNSKTLPSPFHPRSAQKSVLDPPGIKAISRKGAQSGMKLSLRRCEGCAPVSGELLRKERVPPGSAMERESTHVSSSSGLAVYSI